VLLLKTHGLSTGKGTGQISVRGFVEKEETFCEEWVDEIE
jgi:hypothetical protein